MTAGAAAAPGGFRLIGDSARVHARATGAVGVVVLAAGSFAGFVAARLIAGDDVAATAEGIVASELLFRLGVVGGLVMMVAWLFYALLLYRLLRPAGRDAALAMLALVVASVPIYMLNQVNQVAVLLSASAGAREQVALFLELFRAGNQVAAIFFGLWLLPLGLLVFRSGFLPRLLGALLMFGSLGYLALFVQGFLFPGSEGTLWTNPLLVVTHLSELALLLWLLVRGVDPQRWAARASGAAGDRSTR